ncbi:unnamed protein product [Spirodela intermedia]|uniref:Uncharacterized protein n=2 Tax=Spirodela intermedia TaxID=51605 RepID=A0A7I8JJD0_SPIIN|nr:unnamed protein product [Spirodela intermedia]CAA6669981.1 unnamed protein product [Spirodela intermedia]CAA7406964.1 unnamed protein product [Spirodela intermedia]
MSLSPLLVRSSVRLMVLLLRQPATTVTTLLFFAGLLPRSRALERLVHHDLLLPRSDAYLLRLIVAILRSF